MSDTSAEKVSIRRRAAASAASSASWLLAAMLVGILFRNADHLVLALLGLVSSRRPAAGGSSPSGCRVGRSASPASWPV